MKLIANKKNNPLDKLPGLLDSAEKALESGDIPLAHQIFREIQKSDPDKGSSKNHKRSFILSLTLAIISGDTGTAEELLKNGSDLLLPSSARLFSARLKALQGDFAGAENIVAALFETSVQNNTYENTAIILREWARIAEYRHDYLSADSCLFEAKRFAIIANDLNLVEILTLDMVELFMGRNDPGEAEAVLSTASNKLKKYRTRKNILKKRIALASNNDAQVDEAFSLDTKDQVSLALEIVSNSLNRKDLKASSQKLKELEQSPWANNVCEIKLKSALLRAKRNLISRNFKTARAGLRTLQREIPFGLLSQFRAEIEELFFFAWLGEQQTERALSAGRRAEKAIEQRRKNMYLSSKMPIMTAVHRKFLDAYIELEVKADNAKRAFAVVQRVGARSWFRASDIQPGSLLQKKLVERRKGKPEHGMFEDFTLIKLLKTRKSDIQPLSWKRLLNLLDKF